MTSHAKVRKGERKIVQTEILEALRNGYWEKRKDEYKKAFSSWNYAVRGKTEKGRNLRVAVAFEDAGGMLIITVIDLDAGHGKKTTTDD